MNRDKHLLIMRKIHFKKLFRELNRQGLTASQAVTTMAEKYFLSERTVWRDLKEVY